MEFDETEIGPMFGEERRDEGLFEEEGASFIVAVPEGRYRELQEVLGMEVAYSDIGDTGGDKFVIGDFVDLTIEDMREAYERDLFA